MRAASLRDPCVPVDGTAERLGVGA